MPPPHPSDLLKLQNTYTRKQATIADCGLVKRNSAAMETEDAGGGWGGTGSDNGFRAEAMRGMRADVREEKAGISRVVGDAIRSAGEGEGKK